MKVIRCKVRSPCVETMKGSVHVWDPWLAMNKTIIRFQLENAVWLFVSIASIVVLPLLVSLAIYGWLRPLF